jgi:hypothetical protein
MAEIPTKLTWSHDGRNTDGSPFDAEQFAGFLLVVNDEPAVAIPTQWNDEGKFELPFAGLAAFETSGEKRVQMKVVNKKGAESAWSEPFVFELDLRKPTAPFGLQVSR